MRRRVVIVGGGVVGLCCAWYAAREGYEVALLDPDSTETGCSFGNAGMVVPSHFVPLAAPGTPSLGLRMMLHRDSPFGIRPSLDPALWSWAYRFWRSSTVAHVDRSAPLLRDLHLESRRLYEEMESALPSGFGLVKRGLLALCATERALEEEAKLADRACRLGLRASVLSPAELAALDPGIEMSVAGGVHFADDCHLDPGALMSALRKGCESLGVEMRTEAAVGWHVEAARLKAVRTECGAIGGDEFIAACGAWTRQLLRPLGLRLPMQAGKGYSLTLPNPPARPAICSLLTEARIAVTPMGGGLRFAGTLEIAGMDRSINHRRVGGLLRSIPRCFPQITEQSLRRLPVWNGLRPCSPDGLPYVGRTLRYPNLLIAAGHAMLGVSLAPVTGKLIAALVSGESPPLASPLISPDRFG